MRKGYLSKRILSSLAAAMLITAAAGCGTMPAAKDSGGDTPGNSSVSETDKKVTFQFIQAQPEYQEAAGKLVNAYMQEHPNVTIELITDNTNLKTNLQAGNIPEIFYTEGYNVMKAYAEYITDLSDQPWVSGISDEALECVTMDGKVVGMPFTIAGEGIVYNKKMFEEHGWEIPVTWTELKALCEEIQAAGVIPFVNEFGDAWLLGQLMSAGGYAYIPDTQTFTDQLYAGEVSFSQNEQMKKSFEVIDLMLKYGLPDPLSYTWNETCSAFATGEAAMAFEGDWIWDTVYPINQEIECGMFALPITDNPADTKMIVDANMCWHVGKGSAHPEAAIAFIDWVTSSETAKTILLEDYKVVPCFKGWEYQGANQLAESTMQYKQEGKTYKWWWQKWPDSFRENAGKEYQKYVAGETTAEQTLEAIDKLWKDMTAVN